MSQIWSYPRRALQIWSYRPRQTSLTPYLQRSPLITPYLQRWARGTLPITPYLPHSTRCGLMQLQIGDARSTPICQQRPSAGKGVSNAQGGGPILDLRPYITAIKFRRRPGHGAPRPGTPRARRPLTAPARRKPRWWTPGCPARSRGSRGRRRSRPRGRLCSRCQTP